MDTPLKKSVLQWIYLLALPTIYLLVVPTLIYFVGLWLIPSLEWRRVLATLGIFFGMTGIVPFIQTEKNIRRIQSLGIWRGVVVIAITLAYFWFLFAFLSPITDHWLWSILYNWLGGVWGGILLQMIFNEQIGERLFPPKPSP
jgi:hypothetical protein